jgi:hypothetical protein
MSVYGTASFMQNFFYHSFFEILLINKIVLVSIL